MNMAGFNAVELMPITEMGINANKNLNDAARAFR